MYRDGCYFITDKKPRRDRLRWEGHTEKNGRTITETCLALAPRLEVGDNAMWKTDIKSTMEDRE